MPVPFSACGILSIVFLILAALLRNIPRTDVYLNSNYIFHCFICLAIVPNNQNPFNKLLEIGDIRSFEFFVVVWRPKRVPLETALICAVRDGGW